MIDAKIQFALASLLDKKGFATRRLLKIPMIVSSDEIAEQAMLTGRCLSVPEIQSAMMQADCIEYSIVTDVIKVGGADTVVFAVVPK